MKFIQKSRLETFLNLKGYKAEVIPESTEQKDFAKWTKLDSENVHIPKKDILNSAELSNILNSQELLKEFRRF